MHEGTLSTASFAKRATVCKYLVPEGYPTNPKKDAEIKVNESQLGDAKLYYASVYEKDGKIFTTGSRAIAVVGIANTLSSAEQIAERACNAVQGPLFHRRDIGTSELITKKIERMKKLRSA